MTFKGLLFKILIIAAVLVVLFILMLYFTIRTKVDNLAEKKPYTELIGTEQSTKQICYIAKGTPYILKFENQFYPEKEKVYEVPLGTLLKIENAKAYTNGVSGLTSNMILGKVFIKELNQEVSFSYNWDPEKALDLENLNDYLRYPAAPWQNKPLALKFSVEDNSKSSYQWPARTSIKKMNILLATIWCNFKFKGNRDFENTTFEKDRYLHGMNSYYKAYYQITTEDLPLLQLTNIYPDFEEKPSKYIVGKDHRLNLSPNFVSLIITVQIENDTIEQTLINYDANGNYIDHLLISKADRVNGSLRVSSFEDMKVFVEYQPENDSKKIDRIIYIIAEDGFVSNAI